MRFIGHLGYIVALSLLIPSSTAAAEPFLTSDPLLDVQWAIRNVGQLIKTENGIPDADMDATDAWAGGLPTGKVVMAVLDTGIDYVHEDLYLNVWINQGEIPSAMRPLLVDVDGDGIITFWDLNNAANSAYISDLNSTGFIDAGDIFADAAWCNGVDDESDGYIDDFIGWDFLGDDHVPEDLNGHGSRVASIFGAITNNGIGVAGNAFNRGLIMMLRFETSPGVFITSDMVAALTYAVAHGATISVNSYGVTTYDQAMYDAIQAAGQAGHLFVNAAGNNAQDIDLPEVMRYPAEFDLDNVLAVGVSHRDDALWVSSNWGLASVDLVAPGSDVMKINPNNQYDYGSGSSYSAPYVAGVAALLKLQNPSWSILDIKAQIMGTVDVLPAFTGKTVSGGRLNMAKALGVIPSLLVKKGAPSGQVMAMSIDQFRLTFGDVVSSGSLSPEDIAMSGPGGAIAISSILEVSGSGGREFDVYFSAQSTPGLYSYLVGPNVLDALGRAMDQDSDGLYGEAEDDRFSGSLTLVSPITTYTNNTIINIPDRKKVISSITVEDSYSIADVNVQVNITHPYDADMDVYLISPAGTRVQLFTDVGGSGDNFNDTVLDQEAATPITGGTAPFAATYRPEGSLTTLNGQAVNGLWKLEVADDARNNVGSLNGWSLIVTRP